MRKIIKITCVIICMIIIFLFSHDNGVESSSKSDGVVLWTCSIMKDYDTCANNRSKYIDPYTFFARRLAHFSIYFILGMLLISTVCEYRLLDMKSIIIAFIIAFLYACSDEFHQLFVNGRSARIVDVFLDGFGSFIGIMIYRFYYKWRKKV